MPPHLTALCSIYIIDRLLDNKSSKNETIRKYEMKQPEIRRKDLLYPELSYEIVGCAVEVQRHLGPGLLESIYSNCLLEELNEVGLRAVSQVEVPVQYKGKLLAAPLRLDILVNDLVVVEVKAVDIIIPVFKAQLLTYLKLSGRPKGLLLNFNCEQITRDGLVPLVTQEFGALPKS